jgi:hypothetical protein
MLLIGVAMAQKQRHGGTARSANHYPEKRGCDE